jgi:hypothetical protein
VIAVKVPRQPAIGLLPAEDFLHGGISQYLVLKITQSGSRTRLAQHFVPKAILNRRAGSFQQFVEG